MLGKSPAWQDADGACSGYLVESGDTACCSTAATACSGSCARSLDYADVDAVVISHLHADHILDLVPFASALTYAPRHQPVPVDGWPGTAIRRARAARAAGSARHVPARRAAPGAARTTSRTRSGSTEYDPGDDGRGRPLEVALPAACRTSSRPTRSSSPPAAAAHVFGADSSPTDELCEFARDDRPAADRGHAAAARARRPARASDAERGRRARPPRGRAAAGPHPHVGRARRRLGARGGRARLRRPGRGRPRGRHLPV